MDIEKMSKCSIYGAVTLAWLIMGILSSPDIIYGFNTSSALVGVSGNLCLGNPYDDPACVEIDDLNILETDFRQSTGEGNMIGISGSVVARVDSSGFKTYTTMEISEDYDGYGGVSADAGYQMGLYVFDGYSDDDVTLTFSYDLNGSLSISDPTISGLAGVGVQLRSFHHTGGGMYNSLDSDKYVNNLGNSSGGPSGESERVVANSGDELSVLVPVNEWFFLTAYLVSTSQLDGPDGFGQILTSNFQSTLSLNSLQADGRTIYSTDVDLFGIPDLQQGTWGQQVPIPSAVWLLGAGLIGLVGIRGKFRS